jgi:hypothetical protein
MRLMVCHSGLGRQFSLAEAGTSERKGRKVPQKRKRSHKKWLFFASFVEPLRPLLRLSAVSVVRFPYLRITTSPFKYSPSGKPRHRMVRAAPRWSAM